MSGLAASLRDFFVLDSESCSRIEADLMVADLPLPDAVIRLQDIVGSFRQARDKDGVTTAAATWVDLVADHDSVRAGREPR